MENHPEKKGKLSQIGNYKFMSSRLGEGSFSKVELAKHLVLDKDVAIKIIRVDKIKDPWVMKNLQREAEIMSKLDHPNILRLHEVCAHRHFYCLVLDFWVGGNLGDFICQNEAGKLPEEKAQKLFKQILNGVEYIHSRNVVHRDIKPENILINKQGDHIVLGDFGLSNFCKPGQLLRTHCGSPEFTAPEVLLSSKNYTKEVDIWSIGVVLFCMVSGLLPFSGQRKGKGKSSLKSQIRVGLTESHYSALVNVSESCRSLLHQILSVGVDVNKRPRLHEIQLSSWCFSLSAPRLSPLTPHQNLDLEVAKKLKEKLNLAKWSPANILDYVHSSGGKLGKTAGCFSLIAADLRQQQQQKLEAEKEEDEAQPHRSPAATITTSVQASVIKPGSVPVDDGRERILTSKPVRPVDFKKDEKPARMSGGKENKPSTKMMKTKWTTPTPVKKSGLGYIDEIGGGLPRPRNAPFYERLAIIAPPVPGTSQDAVKEDSVVSRDIKKRRRSSSTFGQHGHQPRHGVNKMRANTPNSGETKPFKYLDKTSQI